MSKDWTVAEVTELPKCDFCDSVSAYDGATVQGPWAFMCEMHWSAYGIGRLGAGLGQRLVKN